MLQKYLSSEVSEGPSGFDQDPRRFSERILMNGNAQGSCEYRAEAKTPFGNLKSFDRCLCSTFASGTSTEPPEAGDRLWLLGLFCSGLGSGAFWGVA